jgi:hypothetical protein
MRGWSRRVLFGLVVALVAAGCGGDDGGGAGEDGGGSATIQVPQDHETIQEAVDAASPGDLVLISPGTYEEEVNVTVDDLVIRGLDRDEVVLEGGFELENGIRVLEADGVAVENLTAQHFTGNGFFWTGVDGYRGSYLTSVQNGLYGVYAFGSVNGILEHSYASGNADSGFYVGQCQPCNALVQDVVSEWNGIGFSDTDAGGNLAVVESVFRQNRLGMLAVSASWEGCAPQRESTFVGNLVEDNNNTENAAIGPAVVAQTNGILVGGGLGNMVERNRVRGHETAGIGVVPFPEDDPVALIPAEADRPVDCVEAPDLASDEELAAADNPIIWPAEDNRVAGNVVEDNGEWDLVALTLDGEAHGNCFDGNDVATGGVVSPPDIDTVLPCDGEPGTFSPEIARFLEILNRPLEAPPDYEDVDLPDPGPQDEMPDAADAPAEPGRAPEPVDLDAIGVPEG